MPGYNQMLYHIEMHFVAGITQYFNDGGDPNETHDGMPLFTAMVEMYTRTPRFKDCVKAFVLDFLTQRGQRISQRTQRNQGNPQIL
jgi:hypothetical protein